MPFRNVTRRVFVGVVGGGVLAAPIVAAAGGQTTEPQTSSIGTEPATRETIQRLLHPLKEGEKLARFTIVQIDPIVNGCVSVKVRADDGHTFDIEVLARDVSSMTQRPPAETERHAFFVVNGGDGWAPTHEEQGLAAMTLAEVVRRNERDVRLSGFLTFAERLSHHGEALLVPVCGDPQCTGSAS